MLVTSETGTAISWCQPYGFHKGHSLLTEAWEKFKHSELKMVSKHLACNANVGWISIICLNINYLVEYQSKAY